MTYQNEIDDTHPMNDFDDAAYEAHIFAADKLAMKLVGERHSKRDLVNLVRWLITKTDLIQ